MIPSPPMPKFLSHNRDDTSDESLTSALSRLSTRMKSLPRPWYLTNSIVVDPADAVTARGVDARVDARRATRVGLCDGECVVSRAVSSRIDVGTRGPG
jgi:hypothetical protein